MTELLGIFRGTTPWGPIIAVVVVIAAGAIPLALATRRAGYAVSYSLLVVAVASAFFGMIATVAFFWAVAAVLLAVTVLIATVRQRGRT